MSSKLKSFRRRAAGHVEEGALFSEENLNLLFAPGSRFLSCIFTGTLLQMGVFNGATLERCSFRNSALAGTSFRGAQLAGVRFEECGMTGVSFEGATLTDCIFVNCSAEGASFHGAQIRGRVLLTGCDFRDTDFRFYECDAGQPCFAECDLRSASFAVNCEFWNATFDARAIADFGRVYARASKDPALIALARQRFGEAEYDKVDAYMRRD